MMIMALITLSRIVDSAAVVGDLQQTSFLRSLRMNTIGWWDLGLFRTLLFSTIDAGHSQV